MVIHVVNDYSDSPIRMVCMTFSTTLFIIRLNMINKDLLPINHLTIIDFSTRVMLSR